MLCTCFLLVEALVGSSSIQTYPAYIEISLNDVCFSFARSFNRLKSLRAMDITCGFLDMECEVI